MLKKELVENVKYTRFVTTSKKEDHRVKISLANEARDLTDEQTNGIWEKGSWRELHSALALSGRCLISEFLGPRRKRIERALLRCSSAGGDFSISQSLRRDLFHLSVYLACSMRLSLSVQLVRVSVPKWWVSHSPRNHVAVTGNWRTGFPRGGQSVAARRCPKTRKPFESAI